MRSFDNLETTKIIVIQFRRVNLVRRLSVIVGAAVMSAFCLFVATHAMQERPFRCFHPDAVHIVDR